MAIVCVNCGRDLNKIYHCNMSYEPNRPLCEDCCGSVGDPYTYDVEPANGDTRKWLSKKQFKFLMRYAGWGYFKVKNSSYDKSIRKIEQIIYCMRRAKQKIDISK